ncbi:MAG: DUF1127 domain-containing protein [Pseudomonadota bacterium]
MKTLATYLNGTIGSALTLSAKRPAVSWFRRAKAAIQESNRAQRDYERLLEMPDHVLRDIGLQRYQVLKELRNRRNALFWTIGR